MFKFQFNLSSLAQAGDTFIETKNHSQERLWDFRYAIPDWQTLKTTVASARWESQVGALVSTLSLLPVSHTVIGGLTLLAMMSLQTELRLFSDYHQCLCHCQTQLQDVHSSLCQVTKIQIQGTTYHASAGEKQGY